MYKSTLIVLFSVLFILVDAHPWKPAHYIIIDTDGGYDDMRTITMFLSSPNVRVLAITSSNGVLDANETYFKIKSLLNDLNHEGLLTGANPNTVANARNYQHALAFKWGSIEKTTDSIPNTISVIDYLLSQTREKISFVCLGSLATASDCFKQCALFKSNVKEIVWTSDILMNEDNFNYTTSPESFEYLTKETNIPIHLVCGEIGKSPYDEVFTSVLDRLDTPYSKKILQSLISSHSPYSCNWFDESAAVYLHYPFLYSSDTLGNIVNHNIRRDISRDSLQSSIVKILAGETVNQNQVLKSFPFDTSSYFSDVQKRMIPTMRKFGKEEWIACVLGNELHRHLGVYAVIGVKMGIRAREYFGAGIDELQIHSYAGMTPPYSCMNDGLQVSTGGTLGHGLIDVDTDSLKLPKAKFTYLGQTIYITLKDEYRKKIEAEIGELSAIYGLNSNIYWELVRMAAINYWSNWNRNEIFDIQVYQQFK